MSDLVAAVSAYADRLHRDIVGSGADHHVASPLGAWLVLALVASAAGDDALVPALGAPRDEAAAAARDLLARPHPVVALAAAAWESVGTPEVAAWLRGLGEQVETGPVPAQPDVDRWAAEHTFGLIDRFPVRVAEALLVLASAVATRISWPEPFGAASAEALMLPAADGFVAAEMLRAGGASDVMILDSAAGLLAVHSVPSDGLDLVVVSVIADEAVAAADTLAAAHAIALQLARGTTPSGRVRLADLPLGRGHAWTLREVTERGADHDERYEAVLPAWTAASTHDLLDLPRSGFPEAATVLGELAGGDDIDATQVAVARYTSDGFEAAAVTAMVARASAMVRADPRQVRVAHVEFTRPHAVVAVAVDRGSPWHGLPVFSAWITHGTRSG